MNYTLTLNTKKQYFKINLFISIALLLLLPILHHYVFNGYNIIHILIIIWLFTFLFQHIKILEKTMPKAKKNIEEIYINIKQNQQIVPTLLSDIQNNDIIQIKENDIIMVEGIIKNGLGIFDNEKSYRKRGDKIKKGSMLKDGTILYKALI